MSEVDRLMGADLEIQPMTTTDAEAVAEWRYPGVYAFYDFTADADDLAELLDAGMRDGRYYSVSARGCLVGFCEIMESGSATVEIGLGLRPDLTGRGVGLRFVSRLCEWVECHRRPETLQLLVAEFNQRAIKVYKRAGFEPAAVVVQASNGEQVRFVRMVKPASRSTRAARPGDGGRPR